MSEKILCFRPEYYEKFQCDGSICTDNCCKRAWNIEIDEKTYQFYQAADDAQQDSVHFDAGRRAIYFSRHAGHP